MVVYVRAIKPYAESFLRLRIRYLSNHKRHSILFAFHVNLSEVWRRITFKAKYA